MPLYKDKNFFIKMTQMNYIRDDNNEKNIICYGNSRNYSFIIPLNSINKFDL